MTDQNFTSTPAAQGFSFTLRDFAAIGFRHKRMLGMCFGGLLLGTIAAALLIPPKYQAVTKILVKRERVDPVVTPQRSDTMQVREDISEEEMNSEIELIESDDVLRQTVIGCGLQQHKSLLSRIGFRPSEDEKISKAIMRLKADLHVELLKKSNIISLTYSSSDPKQAARVLTVLSNAYIDQHLAVHRPAGQVKFFEQETERYHQNLQEAESQLKRFADETGGVAPQLARDMTLQKLNDFSATLETTRAEMASTEQRIRDLEKQLGSTPDRMTTSVRESDNAQVLEQMKSTLMTLELKRTELLTKYQPTYRLVQEIDKQIADTRSSIESEQARPLKEQTTDQNPTYSWIRTELAKAKADYSALQARAAATSTIVGLYQNNARALEEKGLIQQDLLRTAKTTEENYLLYLRKQEEARMADALDERRILNVAVAERPNVPLVPTNSPWLFGLVGILLSATVSVGVVFAVEYMDPSFRTPSEVASELNIPVLASVPHRFYTNGHENGNGNGRNGTNGSNWEHDHADDAVDQRVQQG
jgi:succinoglycan biosynthesis transport protein ExoP